MRPASFLVTLLALVATLVQAQTPTTLNYQGRLLQNTADQDAATGTVEIRFSIWTGPATEGTATELWNETWTDVALSNGIFSVLLGSNGSPLDPADFQGDDSLFLQLEVDGETLSPRQQLGSAPFAFVDDPANELQELSLDGNDLSLSGSATTVDLSPYLDDTDTTIDNQQLSLNGNSLELTSDDGVDTIDLSEVQVIQELIQAVAELIGDGRIVFASSVTFHGALGGLEGADAECQALADAAGLVGTYKAWLSDDTGSPSTRFTQDGSFELVDGTVIADDWAELTSGTLQAAISIDEAGDSVSASSVWTNTRTSGAQVASGNDCANWTDSSTSLFGGVGFSSQLDVDWTATGVSVVCSASNPIYCFEQ